MALPCLTKPIITLSSTGILNEKIQDVTNLNKVTDNITNITDLRRTTNGQSLRKPIKLYQKIHKEQRRNYKMYELSKTKNLTITCPEIDNTTFTNASPFNVLGVPECGDKVKPKFRLIYIFKI